MQKSQAFIYFRSLIVDFITDKCTKITCNDFKFCRIRDEYMIRDMIVNSFQFSPWKERKNRRKLASYKNFQIELLHFIAYK